MINKYLKTLLNGGVPEREVRPVEDGLAAFEEGRHEEAQALLERALAADPEHVEVMTTLGRIHLAAGRFAEAQQVLLGALAIDHLNAAVHYTLGEVGFHAGQSEMALKHYQRAIQVDPDFTDAHIRLGMLYRELNQLDEAVKAFERAIFLDRCAVVARFHLAQVCIAKGDPRRALTQLHLVKELHGDYPPVFVLQGELQLGLGDYRQAIVEFERALELGVDDASLHWQLSEAHHRLGDKDQALKRCLRALEHDPGLAPARLRAAELCEAQRKYAQAQQHFEALFGVEGYDTPAREGAARVAGVLAEIAARLAGDAAPETPPPGSGAG